MRYNSLITFVLLFFFVSCQKEDENILPKRSDPESRNQEGSKLLGKSRVENGEINWSTFYYEPGSNRILKKVDSVMSLTNISDKGWQLGLSEYRYDSDGKLMQITYGNSITNFSYDSSGMMIKEDLLTKFYSTYAYDNAGRIIEAKFFDPATNRNYSRLSFEYDANNNLLTHEQWIYNDNAGSLVKLTTASFTYDNKLHPYSGIDQQSFLYEKTSNNNIVKTSFLNPDNSTNQQTFTYTYNNLGLPKVCVSQLDPETVVTDKYYYY